MRVRAPSAGGATRRRSWVPHLRRRLWTITGAATTCRRPIEPGAMICTVVHPTTSRPSTGAPMYEVFTSIHNVQYSYTRHTVYHIVYRYPEYTSFVFRSSTVLVFIRWHYIKKSFLYISFNILESSPFFATFQVDVEIRAPSVGVGVGQSIASALSSPPDADWPWR